METTTTTTETSTAGMLWQKSKWIIKGLIVGLMALVLMIPMIYVKDMVKEREETQRQATAEISSKWAGPQNIAGPVLGVPYWQAVPDTGKKNSSTKHIAYFLPDVLNITSNITPTEKHRGIFKVMLYNTKINLKGSFDKLAFEKLNIPADKFIWNEAFVELNLSDIKGLNDPVKLTWKDSMVELAPQNAVLAGNGLSAPLNALTINDVQNISFTADIDLKGSEKLLFSPLGKSTIVEVSSGWKDPSFDGSILPQTSELKETGFKATWKSMSHTRKFPQQWIDDAYNIDAYVQPMGKFSSPEDYVNTRVTETNFSGNRVSNAAFGVNLFIPVNGYQKTLRTVKYALLCILLTFAAFFLIETVHKKSAHPFQYGLVGLALILFYTLLLSFSEYIGFNSAYIIASVATIGLIAWFVKSILQSTRPTMVLTIVLVLIYSYVFSILQLQDYALLFGSIGLFITLAIIMYFSRKISW